MANEQLREMFCVKDKYSKANDFKRRVLDVAKKNLMRAVPTHLTTST
ncbi:hypothetical protein [Segatella buccae]